MLFVRISTEYKSESSDSHNKSQLFRCHRTKFEPKLVLKFPVLKFVRVTWQLFYRHGSKSFREGAAQVYRFVFCRTYHITNIGRQPWLRLEWRLDTKSRCFFSYARHFLSSDNPRMGVWLFKTEAVDLWSSLGLGQYGEHKSRNQGLYFS